MISRTHRTMVATIGLLTTVGLTGVVSSTDAASAVASPTPRPTVHFFSEEPLAPAEDLDLVPVGPGVHDPVTDGRSVWVPHELGITRYDAMTGALMQRFSVGANASVAVDDESAWIASFARDIVVPVDPASGEVHRDRAVSIEAPGAMALGFGSLWVLSPGRGVFHRIDPTDGRVLAAIDVGTWGTMAVGPDAVWLSSESAGGLLRVDPETNDAEPIDVGARQPTSVAVGAGAVWVATFMGQLIRYDPVKHETLAQQIFLQRPGSLPIFGLRVTEGAVWLSGSARIDSYADVVGKPGHVARLDPISLEVQEAHAIPAAGFGNVLAGDSLWVATGYEDIVRLPIAGGATEQGPAPSGSPAEFTVAYEGGITYSSPSDSEPIPLDVYAPRGAVDAPVVILVPGGPLPFGNRHYLGSLAAALADRGAIAIPIDYRSSATGQGIQQAREDLACAVAWARAHASEHGGDPDRVIAVGHSYGSEMVLHAAVGGDERVSCQGTAQRPDAVVGIAGFTVDIADQPPTGVPIDLVVGSEDDNAFSAGPLHDRLLEAGYDATLLVVEGANHDDIYDATDSQPTLGLIMEAAGL